jgi:hypothetical protein
MPPTANLVQRKFYFRRELQSSVLGNAKLRGGSRNIGAVAMKGIFVRFART